MYCTIVCARLSSKTNVFCREKSHPCIASNKHNHDMIQPTTTLMHPTFSSFHKLLEHTAKRVQSIAAIRSTLRVRLHEPEPSVWSLSNGTGLVIPALLMQISNPPYVSKCFLNAKERAPAIM